MTRKTRTVPGFGGDHSESSDHKNVVRFACLRHICRLNRIPFRCAFLKFVANNRLEKRKTHLAEELALILLSSTTSAPMLAKLIASWLVVLAALPFTAPFSTFTLGDVLGTRPSKRSLSDVVASFPAAEADAADLATNPTTKDVRPVAASHGETRLMPVVLPGALAVISSFGRNRRLIPPDQAHENTVPRPLTVLRR